MPLNGPDFSISVPQNGYAWWYVDALSDDGHHGLTMIAFIGSVFSPYYALARRRGRGDPANYCSLNVALYGRGGKRWAMTERGRAGLRRDETHLKIGPSALAWAGSELIVDVEEVTVPIPSRLRGRITVHSGAINPRPFTLRESGQHQWRPIMPTARVDVDFGAGGVKWSGSGYFDHNTGAEPLEAGFKNWTWCRSAGGNKTMIFYDMNGRDNDACSNLALSIDKDGSIVAVEPPPTQRLQTSNWGISRSTRSEMDLQPRVVETLEDTPFYARSVISASIEGKATSMVHESLSLDRFAAPWVQAMLPFKMPRRTF
jgi:carotenoid 1,2-hydratase